MNTIVVSKFSGSAMSEAVYIKKAAEVMKSKPSRRFAVVSAPAKGSGDDIGVTDMLYICHARFNGRENYVSMLENIRGHYDSIIQDLGTNYSIDNDIDLLKEELASGKSADYMASRGEYIMAGIFADYLGWERIDAAELIFFNADGSIDEEKTFSTANEILMNTNRAVIPGFYGTMPDGNIKTFPRGGGDFTGGLIARSLNAKMFEKWNATTEIFRAEPSIVGNPEIARNLTYSEAIELNYIGIKTVLDEVIKTLRKAAVPITIHSLSNSEDSGTLITEEIPEGIKRSPAVCIAGRRRYSIVHMDKYALNKESGFGGKLFGVFAKYKIACEHCLSGIHRLSVVVKSPVFDVRRMEIMEELKSVLNLDSISIEKDLSIIAIIGKEMGRTIGTFEQAFAVLAKEKIRVRMIDQGSDELNLIIGVDDKDYNNAVKALYSAMILAAKPLNIN